MKYIHQKKIHVKIHLKEKGSFVEKYYLDWISTLVAKTT